MYILEDLGVNYHFFDRLSNLISLYFLILIKIKFVSLNLQGNMQISRHFYILEHSVSVMYL